MEVLLWLVVLLLCLNVLFILSELKLQRERIIRLTDNLISLIDILKKWRDVQ
jgi:hypothetical protein